MGKAVIRLVIIIFLGLGLGAGLGYLKAQYEIGAGVVGEVTKSEDSGEADIGGDFMLTDHNGKAVSEATYSEDYKLVFFGFTHCPAVCPTELKKVADVMDELGERAEDITPLFITVDPARDSAEVMKEYVEKFHPKMVGLTGSQEQIDDVMKEYRVYATKVENDFMDGYMMDHSAFLYFMTPDDKMAAIYPSQDTVENIVTDIKKLVPATPVAEDEAEAEAESE